MQILMYKQKFVLQPIWILKILERFAKGLIEQDYLNEIQKTKNELYCEAGAPSNIQHDSN